MAGTSSQDRRALRLVGKVQAIGQTLMKPGDGKGTKITEIREGTSNRIALAEAKRGIPWMKSEAIPFDKDQPVP